MGKIKAKMDIIRANQRKTIDSVDYKPKHHYQGNLFGLIRGKRESDSTTTNHFNLLNSFSYLSLNTLVSTNIPQLNLPSNIRPDALTT